MNYKKILKNSKAISPIFATLILIAIAVIAGVVVYMFTSGTLATMTGGGIAAQEKVSVQAVQVGSPTGKISIYAQSTGGSSVLVDAVIFKDASGNVVGYYAAAAISGSPITSALTPLVVTNTTALVPIGSSFTATIVSTKGGSFVSPSFIG
jgi:flagellin-like protein